MDHLEKSFAYKLAARLFDSAFEACGRLSRRTESCCCGRLRNGCFSKFQILLRKNGLQ